MFYAQKELGWYLDYEKLYRYFAKGNEVYNAFFYTGTKGREPEKSFIRSLAYKGYTVRTKEVKTIHKDDDGIDEKCDLDVEIVLDMVATADNYDKAIIFSGDSDFERAIELLRSKGKKIVVVSTEKMIAWELLNATETYVDLKNIRKDVEKIQNDNAPPD